MKCRAGWERPVGTFVCARLLRSPLLIPRIRVRDKWDAKHKHILLQGANLCTVKTLACLRRITHKENRMKSNVMTKRIGSTTYTVVVHFSEKSNESVEAKMLRLIEQG